MLLCHRRSFCPHAAHCGTAPSRRPCDNGAEKCTKASRSNRTISRPDCFQTMRTAAPCRGRRAVLPGTEGAPRVASDPSLAPARPQSCPRVRGCVDPGRDKTRPSPPSTLPFTLATSLACPLGPTRSVHTISAPCERASGPDRFDHCFGGGLTQTTLNSWLCSVANRPPRSHRHHAGPRRTAGEAGLGAAGCTNV